MWFRGTHISAVEKDDEDLDAHGPRADELDVLQKSARRLEGSELVSIAIAVTQIVWGKFSAFREENDKESWLVLTAVDSTFIDVVSNDETLVGHVNFMGGDQRLRSVINNGSTTTNWNGKAASRTEAASR